MSNDPASLASAPTEVEGSRFNISRWALQHPDLTRYLMIVLMVLGLAAYFQLGQDEDPPFTFRAMVVRTYWPGATAQQIQNFQQAAHPPRSAAGMSLQQFKQENPNATSADVADPAALFPAERLDHFERGGQQRQLRRS